MADEQAKPHLCAQPLPSAGVTASPLPHVIRHEMLTGALGPSAKKVGDRRSRETRLADASDVSRLLQPSPL